jgi:hypothetical protein
MFKENDKESFLFSDFWGAAAQRAQFQKAM